MPAPWPSSTTWRSSRCSATGTSRSSTPARACGISHLVDIRQDSPGYEGDDPAYTRPAKVFPRAEGRYQQYSALTDRRIGEHLRRLDADVVVGTRPGLNVHIARQTRRGPVRVGQEHLTLDTPLRRG